MSRLPATPRVLHVHPSLAAANPQADRCVRIMNAIGGRLRHTLVSADNRWGALDRLACGISVDRKEDFPAISGVPLPGRLQAIAQALVDYHLVLTYGRGGMLTALAHTSFSELYSLPPLIHHEDGSDETARERRGLRSTWYRRVGLGKAAGLVVPTEVMEGEALVRWQQPLGRVKVIRDGVDLAALAARQKNDAVPRLLKRRGERWISLDARIGGEAGILPFLEPMVDVDPSWHLVILGVGTELAHARSRIGELALDDRVHFVADLPDAAVLIRLSDLVALPLVSEPLPFAAIAAMGAGKAVIGFDSGEVSASLAPDNAPFILKMTDIAGLKPALQQLAGDDFLRRRTGEANREMAEAERDQKAMFAAYRRLYASAMQVDAI